MCGIAGWADPTGGVEPAAVARMTAALAHRGPDGEGVWVDPRGLCGLGHRRLAIIDLSAAASQPMANETGELRLVVNGEIYNFSALRRRLRGVGHRFRSRTDAEVILHGYEEWGLQRLLAGMNGMFAFALWDGRGKCLYLGRDRLGIKPLYYARVPHGGLIFASEARALLEHPAVSRAMDPEGLQGYLAYGYVPHERCIFRGLHKLRPGHVLRWSRDGLEVERWWELRYRPTETSNERAAVQRIQGLVEEAVARRMVADVGVGAFLSGGVDSSTVTAHAVRHAGGGFDTFCIGFDAGSQDDMRYSRLVAERLGTRHHTRTMTGSASRRLLPGLSVVLDEPLYDPSAMATWVLAGLARRHVTVALSGTGGDEVFAGYGWFASQVRYAHRRRAMGPLWPPLAAAGRGLIAMLRGSPMGMRLAGAAKLLGATQPDRSFYLRGFFDAWEQQRLLGSAWRPRGSRDHLWLHERTWRGEWPLVPALLNHDLNAFLPDNCLVLLDRTTMAHGLEARVPLLDHRLVEAAFSLPWQVLSSGDGDKRLLKLVARDLVPPEVLERPKAGFSPPFKHWLRAGDLERLHRGLLEGALAEDGVIDPAFVESLLRHRALRRWNKLWLLLNLEWWYRLWIREERIVTESGEA